jgi:Zn/Cd-binding protein ZinT
VIYCYHYQIEFQRRGNRFCKEIKNYYTESLEPDYENALIGEVIIQFLREYNEKSYVGKYTIKRVDFVRCEKKE